MARRAVKYIIYRTILCDCFQSPDHLMFSVVFSWRKDMNKLLCLFEISFALSSAGVAYCAKMPPGGIPEQKTSQNIQQKSDSNPAQPDKKNQKKQDLTNQSQTIKIDKNIIQAGTIAATGIGGSQLVQGLSEQNIDNKTKEQMADYIKTFRCSYANGKYVNGGNEPVELPGGNDETIKKLRDEYFALAANLKERKKALGLKPGIESEIIINKATAGFYDNKNINITNGIYGSLYRAQMGSESDQTKINKEQEKSAERINTGISAIASGILTNTDINMIKTESTSNPNTEKKVNQKQKEKPEINKVDNKPNSKQTQTKQKEKK